VSFFSHLTAKPWEPEQIRADDLHRGATFSLPRAKLGLRVFFGVATVVFLMLIMAYGVRMELEDWRPQPQVRLLWLNTAMLVLSSIGMQWAQAAARRGDLDQLRNGLIAGGVFAIAFLGGQILAWRQLGPLSDFAVSGPAIAFFYLITGLHGLHLAGGLVAWARTSYRLRDGGDIARLRLSVELCTVYWHFLLLLWLVLFGLLFSGNDNLGILLALCGLK
jgi:cytochrome c oxidase subunit 3